MKWWGALSCLLVTQGLAQGPGGSPVPQCHVRCLQVYSGHNKEFQQVNAALDACIRGCEYFSTIDFQSGAREPLNTLKHCNFSCEDNYEGSLLPACQSGCGFHFDGEVTGSPSPRPRSDAPIPIFSRPVPSPSLPPSNPFINIFRSQGPVLIRRNMNLPLPFLPQAMSEPEQPRSSEEQQRPTIVGLNLPELLSKVSSILPQL